MSRVALVLCGAGHRDGSEIREAVYTLTALDREGVDISFFSLDESQHHVNNHLTGKEVSESRNMLVESARIARGEIQDLGQLKVEDFDGIAFPGGFGAAFNLCDYAVQGVACTVNPVVQSTIRAFRLQNKPICAVCIAPVLIAAAFRDTDTHPTLTVGGASQAAQDIEAMGGKHVPRAVTESLTDDVNRIASAPAYMFGNARPGDVATGIESAVRAFATWL